MEPGDGDSNERQWIHNFPVLDEPDMNSPVGQIHHPFTNEWNDAVAQSGYAYGTNITNKHHFPEGGFIVYFIHSSGDHRAAKHMNGMKNFKQWSRGGLQAGENNNQHYGDSAQTPQNSVGRVLPELVLGLRDIACLFDSSPV
jgi:hypothetical protein